MLTQINAQKACLLLHKVSMVVLRFNRTRLNLISTNFSSKSFGVLNRAAIYKPFRTFSSSIDIINSRNFPQRTYQVVVAATREMGIGKSGKLPWRLPNDVKFFKELTLATTDSAKKNAVLMGRKTWESIPLLYRPLPGRLNIVLTRSASLDVRASENVVLCRSIPSALELLTEPPYSLSIEKVYVIGGGQILREALNSPRCDAIHITEIETSIECDTFIPTIDSSIFRPWYSSIPLVENNIRYSFVTYVRRGLTPGSGNWFKKLSPAVHRKMTKQDLVFYQSVLPGICAEIALMCNNLAVIMDWINQNFSRDILDEEVDELRPPTDGFPVG